MKHAAFTLSLLACSKAPAPTTPPPQQQPVTQPEPAQPMAAKLEAPVCPDLERCRAMFVDAGTVAPLRQLERTVTGELGQKVTALIGLVEARDPNLGTSVDKVVEAEGDKALRALPIDASTQVVHAAYAKAEAERVHLVRMMAITGIVPYEQAALDAAAATFDAQRVTASESVETLCATLPTSGVCLGPAYKSLTGLDPVLVTGPAVVGGPNQVPTVSVGQPMASGDLDKAIIRRYIKRNIGKIQYCYEKALVKKPKLAGTVNTKFTISPQGKVTNAKATGVDPQVSTCVEGVLRSIEFPKPKGGSVIVQYPFAFRQAP